MIFNSFIFQQSFCYALLSNIGCGAALWLLIRQIAKSENIAPTAKVNIGLLAQFVLLLQFGSYILPSTEVFYPLPHSEKYNFILNSNIYLSTTYIILLIINSIYLIRKIFQQKDSKNNLLFSAAYQAKLDALLTRISFRKNIQLLLSQRRSSPFTIGIFRPIIVFPIAIINQLSVEEMEAVLLHEIAHIQRHDYLWNLLQLVMENILYFNPFARLIGKKIRENRELACDANVLLQTQKPLAYAETLLKIAKHATQVQNYAIQAVGNQSSELKKRVEYILQAKKINHNILNIKYLYILIFIFLGIFTFSGPKYKHIPQQSKKNTILAENTPQNKIMQPVVAVYPKAIISLDHPQAAILQKTKKLTAAHTNRSKIAQPKKVEKEIMTASKSNNNSQNTAHSADDPASSNLLVNFSANITSSHNEKKTYHIDIQNIDSLNMLMAHIAANLTKQGEHILSAGTSMGENTHFIQVSNEENKHKINYATYFKTDNYNIYLQNMDNKTTLVVIRTTNELPAQ